MKILNRHQFQVSDKLTLKLLQLEHAEGLFALIDSNREHLKQWLNWLDYNTTVNDSYAFIRKCNIEYMTGRGCVFGIFYKEEQGNDNKERLVGTMSLIELIGEVNLGYWLSEDAQGQGIITTCADYLTKLALTDMGIFRVRIRAAVENKKSRAVPERIGYTLEGVARGAEHINSEYLDAVIYSFIKADLEKNIYKK